MSLLKTKHDPYIKNIFKPVKPDEKTEKMESYCYKGVNSVLYKLISYVLDNMLKDKKIKIIPIPTIICWTFDMQLRMNIKKIYFNKSSYCLKLEMIFARKN